MVATSVSTTLELPRVEDTEDFGRRLGGLVRGGDLLLLAGPLGAGKTALVRGLADGLGVTGRVSSPTFVIARVHEPAEGGRGISLVHVDAYRLGGGLDEMEDLDLDVSLPESVVVVEWGEGKVEELSEARLQVVIHRAAGEAELGVDDHDIREVTVTGVGPRWAGRDLSGLAA